MARKPSFDTLKALEVILYIAERVPDMYTALKVLYYADREHLSKYGRLICGDRYVAMSSGPVPSGAYDLVKFARGDGFCPSNFPIDECFTMEGNTIVPSRKARLEFLSQSDIGCLDRAIKMYGHLGFGELRDLSHDAAFKAADQNDFIPFEAIVRTLSNGDLLLDYLQNR
jgi:uncharacterized phage-associated protein